MDHDLDPKFYSACERAFLTEIAQTIDLHVARIASLSDDEKEKLTESLLFSIASHLSGSSFGGEVEGDQIYPSLGFWRGEGGDSFYAGSGSALHEMVPEVIAHLHDKVGER